MRQPFLLIDPLGCLMLKDILEARPVGGHRLHLCFEDGVEGEVDVAAMVRFTGVFAPLADEAEFARVRVDPALGTVVWPGGADLDPRVLYAAVIGKPTEVTEFRPRPAAE